MLPDLAPNFSQMHTLLSARRAEPFRNFELQVMRMRSYAQVIMAARVCKLTRNAELQTLECAFSDERFCEKVISLVCEELPLFEMAMEEAIYEGESFVLMIEPCGLNSFSGDDVYELFENPDNYGENFSLAAFLLMVSFQENSEDYWQTCAEYFDWPTSEPIMIDHYTSINRAALSRYLRSHGCPELYDAVKMVLLPTGNAFLDTPADDYDGLTYEFTAENLKYLRRQWKQARPMIEAYDTAAIETAANPWKIGVLAEGLRRYSSPRRERVRV